ncbi:hypothetical protein NDU88_001380 [Pleurodeles waltl]|uniref:Uncharacterized protein n=1 Tax=Pleurodeles waltl TaxID=8319 RepID=A0AAV7WKQ1_PLEWA|nr:hypothetical protein NDU88_001380 [Pleurodeles waltl]
MYRGVTSPGAPTGFLRLLCDACRAPRGQSSGPGVPPAEKTRPGSPLWGTALPDPPGHRQAPPLSLVSPPGGNFQFSASLAEGDPLGTSLQTPAIHARPAAAHSLMRGPGSGRRDRPPAPPTDKSRVCVAAHLGARAGARSSPGPAPSSPPSLRHRIAQRRHAFPSELYWLLRSEGIKRAPSLGRWPHPQ